MIFQPYNHVSSSQKEIEQVIQSTGSMFKAIKV